MKTNKKFSKDKIEIILLLAFLGILYIVTMLAMFIAELIKIF